MTNRSDPGSAGMSPGSAGMIPRSAGMQRIAVYCGSSADVASTYLDAAREMGRALATEGMAMVYGGGRTGLMGAAANGVLEHGGEVIGVTIDQFNTSEIGHQGLTELHVMDSMHTRKAKMIELSDGLIALPGGLGTFDELIEGLAWAQLGFHSKPVGLLNTNDYFDPLVSLLDRAQEEGFLYAGQAELLIRATEPLDLIARMGAFQPQVNLEERWAKQTGKVEEQG